MSEGVQELAGALVVLRDEFDLDSVSGSRRLSDGHTLTLRWSGALLEIEREDGAVVLLDPEAVMG